MPGETYCSTANIVGPTMKEKVPEIVTTVRTYPGTYLVRIDESPLKCDVMWADEDFFKLFDTQFIHGTPEDVMKQPNAIALSEKMAKKLYGNINPMGKTLVLEDKHPMEIKAIYKDFPSNSSFHEYQAVGPFLHSFPSWMRDELHWGNIDFETYCLLAENTDTATVGSHIRKVASDETKGELWYVPTLQSLDNIHLYSGKYHHSFTSSPSDIAKVKMLSLLAVIILLVACINYMNLSTARAQKRSREIGISKTLGAKRSELMLRLTVETGIITIISFVLAFGLAALMLPIFNSILNEQLSFFLVFNPVFILGSILVLIITTIIAASYPAIYLSGFPPLLAIRSAVFTGKNSSHAIVRKTLTIGQFAVAVVLIAWVLIIQTQIKYISNKDIGYNPHNLIGIPVPGDKSKALLDEYRSESSVKMASRESTFLFSGNGHNLLKNADDKNGASLWSIKADENFVNTMDLKLIAGKNLPARASEDTITQILLNRKAVEYLEMTPEEVIGKKVLAHIGEGDTYVCGVLENFNFEPLYRPVTGFCIHNGKNRPLNVIMLRVQEGKLSEQLSKFEQIYKKHDPNGIFEAKFPDLDIQKAYESEQRTNNVAISFSILAIFVACMGVFGLTAFMAEQRTKEIGIRKVLGASINNIVSLFTTSYLKILLISLVIAVPVAWWLGSNYLENFAYRISIPWWIFVVASLITIVITILTVCLQAVKAAVVNPVKSIKTE